MKLNLGQVVATPNVLSQINQLEINTGLARHQSGDWGDLDNHDRAKFKVIGFMAPFCVVEDRQTGKKGSVQFQHSPRFYFNYIED